MKTAFYLAATTALFLGVQADVMAKGPADSYSKRLLSANPAASSSRDQSKVIKKEIKLDSFDSVDISGGLKINLTAGSSPRVLIECNEDSIKQVSVSVKNGVLVVSTPAKFTASYAVVNIFVPKLVKLNTAGYIDAKVSPSKGGALQISCHNNCTIESSGEVDKLSVDCDGRSFLRLENLRSKDCIANVSDKSFAKVYASNSINASAKGESVLNVKGSPRVVNKNIAKTSFFKMIK